MAKPILEVELRVFKKSHKKKTAEGITEYNYGCISLDNPALLEYVGTVVKVKIEKAK